MIQAEASSIQRAYIMFLLDRRWKVASVTLDGVEQLGAFAREDILSTVIPRFECCFVHCDFSLLRIDDSEAHEDMSDADTQMIDTLGVEKWRSKRLADLEISEESLAERRSAPEAGQERKVVMGMLFGPGRLVNVSGRSQMTAG